MDAVVKLFYLYLVIQTKFMSKLSEKIVSIARLDIGQKEKPNNSGFWSSVKEAKMKLVGWLKGQSWCSYNAESYWVDGFSVYDRDALPLLKKYFSGSTVQTWKNFRASKEFKTSPNIPREGALAIWQDGTSGLGHMGVVSKVEILKFLSIEGNTNEAGSREGTIVRENSHSTIAPYDPAFPKKRWLMGFVYCDRIA